MAVVHINRIPDMVVLADRNGLGFVHDRVSGDVSSMTITSSTGTSYSPGVMPLKDERCFQFFNVNADGTSTTPRCCVYNDGATTLPLREVISPKISYDRTGNILYMTFWTNFVEGFSGADYDPDQLSLINEDDFSPDTPLVRAMCCAVGTIQYFTVDGGDVPSTPNTSPSTSTSCLVPLFYKPKIIQLRPIPDATGGISIIDFGGVGGGSIVSFKFKNIGSSVEYQQTLSIISTAATAGVVAGSSPPVLELQACDVDAPAVLYICMAKNGVAAGEEGTAGYIIGPAWIRTTGVSQAGQIVGGHSSDSFLLADVPGYRVLAWDAEKSLALVTPDHRPVVLRSEVFDGNTRGIYHTDNWNGTTSSKGAVESEAFVFPPPEP